ncbi:MAG: metallophosphoesterase, partial [Clostridia bacterium]|nr:metallophosphoesterase [Clostridia bacterium]
KLGEYMDSLGLLWATVWGNHDHTYETLPFYGTPLAKMEELFTNKFENCLFLAGDPAMGSGNFTIGICENGKFVEAIFMMDSHTTQTYYDDAGNPFVAEASLNDAQKQWYRDKVNLMKQLGCKESIVVTHQPLSGHNSAMKAAVEDLNAYNSLLTPDSALKGVGWKEEYKDTSFGVLVTTCAADTFGHIHPEDGMHAMFKEFDHTKHAICGHCHENNMSVLYDGVRYTHGLKTGGGANSCWTYDFGLNGGTVFTVGSSGVKDMHHEYVPLPDYFKKENCHGQHIRAPFDSEN